MRGGLDMATSTGLLILRVGFGAMMFLHGWQKLTDFREMSEGFPDPLGIGNQLSLICTIAAEAGCSMLLIFGLATRLAAAPLAFTMCVALFVIHAEDPWQRKELAAAYLVVYAALIATGGGMFSLDRLIWARFRGSRSETAQTTAG